MWYSIETFNSSQKTQANEAYTNCEEWLEIISCLSVQSEPSFPQTIT